MRRHNITILTALMLVALSAGMVAAQGLPWSDHASPYSLLFGNHIDEHQQSKKLGNGNLQGFLYIEFTRDTINGIPVAEHGTEAVGWVIHGVPVEATLLSKDPLTWCVDPSLVPKAPGYTHFHWLGEPQMDEDLVVGQTYQGYLLKLTATRTFYFRHEETGVPVLVSRGIDYASHANIVVGCP